MIDDKAVENAISTLPNLREVVLLGEGLEEGLKPVLLDLLHFNLNALPL